MTVPTDIGQPRTAVRTHPWLPRATHRSARSRATVFGVLLFLALAVVSASAGCGSETTTYLDPQYDFSFTYDTSWDLIETPDGELPAGASRSVGAFDPRGSDAGNDLTFDYVAVDVYVLDPSQTPTFQELTDGFDFYLKQLETSDDSLVVIDQPTVTVVNGRPALLVTYMYTANDTEVRCSEYRIIQPGGAMLFGLYTQSSTANWERNTPDFDIFLNSFTVDASQ